MKTAAVVLVNLVRVLGLALIILGVQFWLGYSYAWIPVHMRTGEALVVCLWVLAAVGMRAGVKLPLVLAAIAWGVVTVGFGMTMGRLLPGAAHEIIRVLHLLIGLGAMGLAEALAGRIRRGAVRAA